MATSLSMSLDGLPPYTETDFFEAQPRSRLSRSSSKKSITTTASLEYGDAAGDAPPPYSASVILRGRAHVKQELVTPFRKALRRSWRLCEVEIDNTQLKLTSIVGGVFKQTQSFTLQFAEVGLASDYTKKEHIIRLRVEARQYLIQCDTCKDMLRFFLALQTAICLALPLELRTLPEDSKRRRNKIRDRERREQRREERRARLQETLQANAAGQRAAQADGVRTSAEVRPSQTGRDEPGNEARIQHERRTRKNENIRQRDPLKWNPRTRQSRFSEKDFPHLLFGTTWEGKDVLYHGRWALVSNQEIFFLITPRQVV